MLRTSWWLGCFCFGALTIDLEKDAARFCPPLAPGCDRSCGPRMDYGSLLQFHAQVLRWLWLADVHSSPVDLQCEAGADHRPSEWEALANLAETAERLDCVAAWWPCFPSEKGAVHQLRRFCHAFRDRTHQAIRWLQEEDGLFVQHLHASHICYNEAGELYKSLMIHEHMRKLVSERAVRILRLDREPRVAPDLPRWAYPPEYPSQESCPLCGVHLPAGAAPAWWAAPTVAEMLKKVAQTLGTSTAGFFVNLGAREGACELPGELPYLPGGEPGDPANCLAAAGHRGIMVEGDQGQFASLQDLYGRRGDIKLLLGWVDPSGAREAVVAALRELSLGSSAGAEEDNVDLLKVDVDNCDCCFVEELLAGGLRPRLIHAEVHSLIAPPLAFRPKLRQDLSQTSLSVKEGAAHLHCSLSAYSALLEPLGYRLSHLVSRDAIFVRGDFVHLFPWAASGSAELAWRHGYRCHPHWRTKHEEPEYISVFGYDFRRWADVNLTLEERATYMEMQLDCSDIKGYEIWVHETRASS